LAQRKSASIGRGRGRVQVEEQALECNSPKWRPAVRQGYGGETVLCQSKEEKPWDGSDLTILFQEVVSFL
jgi:hypothetical protein